MQPLLNVDNDGQEKHVFNQKLICCNVLSVVASKKKVQFPFKARCQLPRSFGNFIGSSPTRAIKILILLLSVDLHIAVLSYYR